MPPPPEISTVSGYETRVTECFRYPGKKVAISWRLFSGRQCLHRGRRNVADTEHRSQVGHSNYDITATWSSNWPLLRTITQSLTRLTYSGKLPLTSRALPSIKGVVDMLNPLRLHIFTLLLTAAMCAIIVQATLLISISRDRAERYWVASTRPYQASAMGGVPRFADEVPSDLLLTRYYSWRHGAGRGAALTKNH